MHELVGLVIAAVVLWLIAAAAINTLRFVFDRPALLWTLVAVPIAAVQWIIVPETSAWWWIADGVLVLWLLHLVADAISAARARAVFRRGLQAEQRAAPKRYTAAELRSAMDATAADYLRGRERKAVR